MVRAWRGMAARLVMAGWIMVAIGVRAGAQPSSPAVSQALYRASQVPAALAGYQTYTAAGLIPGPICSPSLASIKAALAPDTASGYLFFLALPDKSGAHVFAKTQAEHDANKKKYGYL